MPQNPRRICVGRDLWRSSGLVLCSEQDQLEQFAECHVDFWVLPSMKFCHLSTSALPTLWWTRVFLMFMLQWLEHWNSFPAEIAVFPCLEILKRCFKVVLGASSRWPWLNRGTGQDDVHRYFPTSTLCDFVVSNGNFLCCFLLHYFDIWEVWFSVLCALPIW